MMGYFIMLAFLIWLNIVPVLGIVLGEEPRPEIKQIVFVVCCTSHFRFLPAELLHKWMSMPTERVAALEHLDLNETLLYVVLAVSVFLHNAHMCYVTLLPLDIVEWACLPGLVLGILSSNPPCSAGDFDLVAKLANR